MEPEKIDEIVCKWSMQYGISMSEAALNALVDALAEATGSRKC